MIYEIAGLRIKIENSFEYTDKFCKSYLSVDQTSPYDICARVSKEDLVEEKKQSPNFSDGYIENICLYRSICLQLPAFNRFLLHACILQCEESGYAFLGRSGAGKSTHSALWLKYLKNCKIINGDKPILYFNGNEIIAYGTPWQGKEGRGCNEKTTLKGLCFIEKAKENNIQKLSLTETTNRIFTQILLPTDEENVVKSLELTDVLVTNVPAYLLECNISENAVKTSFEAMTGKQFEVYKKENENYEN